MIKGFIIFVVLIGAIGAGVYYFGMNYISGKVADTVTTELDDEQNITEIKALVNENPEIKAFIEEGADADEKDLPFHTADEAAKVIIKKVGVSELQNIYAAYQNGMTEQEAAGLLNDVSGKLTDEEVLALKAVIYNELNR